MEDEGEVIREFPAYGRTVAAHIARGVKPICVGVLLSTAWWYFDQAPKVCIRPDEWRRGRYEFGFLGGMHVVAVPGLDCTSTMLAELLVDLMAAGPALLWAFDLDGSKLYDDEDPMRIAQWVHELSGGKIHYQEAKASAKAMAAAQSRSTGRWLTEYERICARSPEDGLKFYDRGEATKGRVRELFSTPWRETSDAPAA